MFAFSLLWTADEYGPHCCFLAPHSEREKALTFFTSISVLEQISKAFLAVSGPSTHTQHTSNYTRVHPLAYIFKALGVHSVIGCFVRKICPKTKTNWGETVRPSDVQNTITRCCNHQLICTFSQKISRFALLKSAFDLCWCFGPFTVWNFFPWKQNVRWTETNCSFIYHSFADCCSLFFVNNFNCCYSHISPNWQPKNTQTHNAINIHTYKHIHKYTNSMNNSNHNTNLLWANVV